MSYPSFSDSFDPVTHLVAHLPIKFIVGSGEGLGWHAHNHGLFCGTESFFRTGYRAHLKMNAPYERDTVRLTE